MLYYVLVPSNVVATYYFSLLNLANWIPRNIVDQKSPKHNITQIHNNIHQNR